MAGQSSLRSENWVPRCPQCGNGNLLLAPANQCTHGVLAQVEAFCQECQWRQRLADVIKKVYVRL